VFLTRHHFEKLSHPYLMIFYVDVPLALCILYLCTYL